MHSFWLGQDFCFRRIQTDSTDWANQLDTRQRRFFQRGIGNSSLGFDLSLQDSSDPLVAATAMKYMPTLRQPPYNMFRLDSIQAKCAVRLKHLVSVLSKEEGKFIWIETYQISGSEGMTVSTSTTQASFSWHS
jgi:hypothetical protein